MMGCILGAMGGQNLTRDTQSRLGTDKLAAAAPEASKLARAPPGSRHLETSARWRASAMPPLHGNHEDLSRKGALLMEQQVNHFLDRLDQAVQQLN